LLRFKKYILSHQSFQLIFKNKGDRMLNWSKRVNILVILISCLISSSLQAQFIVKQVEYTIPVSYSLVPEDVEIESEEEEALLFMTIPTEKLKQAALEEGREVNTNETTIYVDGENFAAEDNSEIGKTTVISNAKDGVMYMVMWAQKRVMVMTPDDLKKAEEQANAAIEESIKLLSPEMQAQVKASMEQEKQQKPRAKLVANPTGKKMTINGFNCELFTVKNEEGNITGVWAAADDMKITGEVERISGKISKMFDMGEDEETDEWSLVKGKIPVEVREMSQDMEMGEPNFTITSILKIESKAPPADKFYVPGEKEGFTHGSFSDMMKQMMQEQ
jgi:hypothetical protein